MKIIVDAMGGDNAPLEIVRGALDANRNHSEKIVFAIWRAHFLNLI